MTKETEKFLEDAEDDSKNHKLLLGFVKSKLAYKQQQGFEIKPKFKKVKRIVKFKKPNDGKNLF
jgi:hypothetical protein|tara:strand:+ start:66 stop:257 length:192 start_codon:yes stop_codon:yes gene_type:complete